MSFYWYDHILAFFVSIVIPVLSILSGQLTEERANILPPKKHLFYSNGLSLIIGALIVLTAWNISGREWQGIGLAWPVINNEVALYCGILVILYLIDGFVTFYIEKNDATTLDKIAAIVPLTWTEYRHFIFLALAAGIGEEIIFRGFLIPYLMELLSQFNVNTWVIIGIPSILFGISHYYQGMWSTVKISVIAFFFGLIFYLSKSLVLVVVLHSLIDLLSGLMTVLFYKKEQTSEH